MPLAIPSEGKKQGLGYCLFISIKRGLVGDSLFCRRSSGVERFLGKEEVMGSIPIVGS